MRYSQTLCIHCLYALPTTGCSHVQEYVGRRIEVLDQRVPWSSEWPDYEPETFTAAIVLGNGRDRDDGAKWADPGAQRQTLALISTR